MVVSDEAGAFARRRRRSAGHPDFEEDGRGLGGHDSLAPMPDPAPPPSLACIHDDIGRAAARRRGG
jgi:hypothetical protein